MSNRTEILRVLAEVFSYTSCTSGTNADGDDMFGTNHFDADAVISRIDQELGDSVVSDILEDE